MKRRVACLLGFAALANPPAVTSADPLDVPALIVAPSAASRAELSRVIRDALHGAPVTLGDDALTTSNLLAVDHARIRDPAGRFLDGRVLLRPETFELFKRGAHCVLVQSKTGRSWRLRRTECAAMPVATGKPPG